MKITVTGSLGNISKPLAQQLIAAGHDVTIVSSDPQKTSAIEALGAKAAIGSVNDKDFLTKAFSGADAIYTMIPPNFGASDLRAYMRDTGKIYAEAIQQSGVKKVVQLSSIGAHLDSSNGPIKGLHDVEGILNQLDGVAVKYIRAPFFLSNFYNDIHMIKNMGIIGANYSADDRIVVVHPNDIADAVAEELLGHFEGKSIRYIVSDDRTLNEATKTLGTAIGKPELPWVQFTDEQALDGMLKAGIPTEMANNFVEMGTAIRSGKIWEDYDLHTPQTSGKRNLDSFAKEFADKYNAA